MRRALQRLENVLGIEAPLSFPHRLKLTYKPLGAAAVAAKELPLKKEG